jgi:hypothetical protein
VRRYLAVRCEPCGLTYVGTGALERLRRHALFRHGDQAELLVTRREKDILGRWMDIVQEKVTAKVEAAA